MTTPLTLAFLLTSVALTTTGRTPTGPSRLPKPIVVRVAHPGLEWRDVGIGAAALVLLLLGASLLIRNVPTGKRSWNPTERTRP